ncbi:MAG: LytR/AlgR family response regulator transcription factor [Bacteroidia bacterium]
MGYDVLIVEDEAPARRLLARYLESVSGVGKVEFASHGEEALQKLETFQPHVIFLDIEVPGMRGIELAHHLSALPIPPKIIFTTAYSEYAVEAFGLSAVDYLLKPISLERFKKAWEKATASDSRRGSYEKIPFIIDDKITLLSYEEIVAAEVHEKKVTLYLIGSPVREKELHRATLEGIEKLLPCPPFFRISRFVIVNLNYVKELIPWHKSGYKVVMVQNIVYFSSRERSAQLREFLGLGRAR